MVRGAGTALRSGATPSPRAPERPDRVAPTRGTLVAVAALLTLTAWLRFASLDGLSLWADELPHVVAAGALLERGEPELPSGREYRRALLQTAAVAASMGVAGGDEAAARLPSALAGTATVALLWLALRRRFGNAAALAAAAVLAVMPAHVAHSRSARFYAGFALAYGAAAVLATSAIERRSLRHMIAAAGAFVVAVHLQAAALMLVLPLAAVAVFLCARARGDERRGRRRELLLLLGPAAAAVAAFGMLSGLRRPLLDLVRSPVPVLEFAPGLRAGALLGMLSFLPWAAWVVVLPAAAVGLVRAGRPGATIVVHALLPVVAVDVLYRPLTPEGVVPERYLIHLAPFAAAAAGIGIAEAARWALALRRGGGRPFRSAVAVAAAAGALLAGGAASSASIPGAQHPGREIFHPNWAAAAALVRVRPADGILSTSPLAAHRYLGRCGAWLRDAGSAAPYLEGNREVYCGGPLVADAAAARRHIGARRSGWVLADAPSWRRLDPAVRAAIANAAVRVPLPDATVLLYRWDPGTRNTRT